MKLFSEASSLGHIGATYKAAIYFLSRSDAETAYFYLKRVVKQVEMSKENSNLKELENKAKKHMAVLNIKMKIKDSDYDYGMTLLKQINSSLDEPKFSWGNEKERGFSYNDMKKVIH